jgi:hypothetical protein
MARVTAAHWEAGAEDLGRQVDDALRELNPTLTGLIDLHGEDTEVRRGVRHARLGLADDKPYRVSLEGAEVVGAELPLFEVVADGLRLRRWFLYADRRCQLGYATELVSPEEVARRFDEGRLTTSVPAGAWVTLDGLGRFQAGEGFWPVRPGERVREAEDLLEELNGRPGAIRRCLAALKDYQSGPSAERREALRQAYEAVPEHLRRFCGDMDSRDWPIRRILAEKDEQPANRPPS